MNTRRDTFALLRDTMRWRVALMLAVLIVVLTLVLGLTNTHLGLHDTARLAWAVMGISAACVVMLLAMPRAVGGRIFFIAIATLLVGIMAFGLAYNLPMQHWAYIFPPVVIFLMRAGPALLAMVLFGSYASLCLAPLVAGIDVIRFASGYGLLVCFMYTYAQLQQRAAGMLRYLSTHDALCACLNRRSFNEDLQHLAATAKPGQRCALLLIDIDHFKQINDQHGHLTGDRVIVSVASMLAQALHGRAALYRYGGEEFAVLLRDADASSGLELAERLRSTVADSEPSGVAVRVSVGIAEWQAAQGSMLDVVDRADKALYRAKRAGRNQARVDPPPQSTMRRASSDAGIGRPSQ